MIVVEGPDNGGKSTFGRSLDLPYFSAGPAPKTAAELRMCIVSQRSRSGLACVQDRLTCISQQVYSDAPESELLDLELMELVKIPRVVVVYCRPPERVLMDFSTHQLKSYDTEESIQKIVDNQHKYIERYDALMARIPHVPYDWTMTEPHEFNDVKSMLLKSQSSDGYWSDLVSFVADSKRVIHAMER